MKTVILKVEVQLSDDYVINDKKPEWIINDSLLPFSECKITKVDILEAPKDDEKYLYSVEPFTWKKTKNGDWNEHLYPAGTKVKVIGKGIRGYDVEICETKVEMYETGLMNWSDKPINNN